MDTKTVKSSEELKELKWLRPALEIQKEEQKNLAEILQGLQLLARDDDREAAAGDQQWDADTPASMQVIKSGAAAATKHWTKVVANAGGAAGFLTLVTGFVVSFVKPLQKAFGDGNAYVPIAVSLIGGASLILAAVALSLALFVKGDLEARGLATAARHQGRSEVAAAFLRVTGGLPKESSPNGQRLFDSADEFLLAAAACGDFAKVKIDVPTEQLKAAPVTGLRRLPDGRVQVQARGGDWIGIDVVSTFQTS